jgi:hypothetical protein
MGNRAVASAGRAVVHACIRSADVSRAAATAGAACWLRWAGVVWLGDLATARGVSRSRRCLRHAWEPRCSRAACIAASGIRFTVDFSSGPLAWRSRRRAACTSCCSDCFGFSLTPKQRMKNGCSLRSSAAILSMLLARRVSFHRSLHPNEPRRSQRMTKEWHSLRESLWGGNPIYGTPDDLYGLACAFTPDFHSALMA